ncbi:MAG TPA: MerR family transcriptional regulator [Candidatus Bathyarchaeia archaeon]|nr:MerR family transcriptional regulator [Candidatus Bathyarchaeia archaeon]
MKMKKRTFRIGELAKKLNVERFVIRFWEKEFSVKTDRSMGGQRFYDEDDIAVFELIKDLLYNKGFTIAGAKQQLQDIKAKKNKIIPSQKTTMEDTRWKQEKEHLEQQIVDLRAQLHKLRELL